MKELDGLFDRLERAVETEDVAEACELLADALLGLGEAAAAARWRTLALLPPPPQRLAAAIAQTRQDLTRLGLTPGEELRVDPLVAARTALASQAQLPEAPQVTEWAQALLAVGERPAALALLRRLALSTGLAPERCNAVASVLLQQGEWWEAERWLCTSLSKQRVQPRLWFQLARLLLDQGVLDEALESVQQGLAQDPASDWGRNLRARILLAGGGWRSFDQLAADPQGLPGGEGPRADLQRQRGRWQRSGLGRGAAPLLSLPRRLELRRLLAVKGLVVLVHGHGAEPLRWCREQELLPEGLAVQPVASREPLVLGAELRAAGFQPRPEQPAPLLRQLAATQAEQPVGLLVIDRPGAAALPVALGELLPRAARLLVPEGLVTPAEGGPLAELAGWQLFDSVRFSG
ncbi:MAG: hypothetical protein ACK5JJ_08555 [Cyanobacteriota bacterium]|jgi:tetratricopeptide (TPR) repeat protein